MIHISDLIKRLQEVQKLEGDLPVLAVVDNGTEKFLTESDLNSGRLIDWADEDVCLGTDVEEYHQVFVLDI